MSRGFRHFSPAVPAAVADLVSSGLVPIDSTVIVAVSGGPDSTALIHSLVAGRVPWNLIVVHVNHGLRGAASDEDAAFVVQLAAELNVPVRVWKVDSLEERSGTPNEETARRDRYRQLGSQAAAVHASAILTAHTADDQAETLLLRLSRGSGAAGLGGISRARSMPRLVGVDVPIVRPFLALPRTAVESYLSDQGLKARHDATNDSVAIPRNRIRHRVMPELREINAQAIAHISATPDLLREQQEFIEQTVSERWTELIEPGQGVAIRQPALARMHPALRRAAILLAMRRLGEIGVENATIDRILGLLGKRSGTIQLTRGIDAMAAPGLIVLGFRFQHRPTRLLVPGHMRFGDWTVTARLHSTGPAAGVSTSLPGPFELRMRRPGDRYRPAFSVGTSKVQEMTRHLPWLARRHAPVLTFEDRVFWTAGATRIADWAAGEGVWLRAVFLPDPIE